MSNTQQNTGPDIFNFENLGDLVRTVGDCIDGKTNIKIDTNLLSNLTRDLTANIQSSVNETIRKHTENLTKSEEQVSNNNESKNDNNTVPGESNKPEESVPKATVFTHTSTFTTNTVNSSEKSNNNDTSNNNTSNNDTNTNIMDDESGLFLPNTLKFTVNDDDPVFRVYRFILPNIFKNDSIRVEINEQIKKRLGIHFINNTNIDTEFCRHISYRFSIDNVTQINLKSAVSYVDYDNDYINVKFLKYSTNDIDNVKEIKVIHSVNPKNHAFYTNTV
jgi:hypothetical protein